MLKRIFAAFIIALLFASTGCSTIRLMHRAAPPPDEEPAYSEVKDFYFWGLKGEHHVYLADICKEREVTQFARQQTFFNGMLAALTLGIYAPQTVMVWCKKTADAK